MTLVQYYVSPNIPQESGVIHEIYSKCTAVQKFLNNIRNRALKTDGGYLITYPDMDECLNKLAKEYVEKSSLATKSRYETYAMMIKTLSEQLHYKNSEIKMLKLQKNQLQEDVENLADALFNQRGSSIIFELDALLRELSQLRIDYKDLEQRVREKVRIEVAGELERLRVELEIRNQRFKDFQMKIAAFVKSELRQSSNNISNYFRNKMMVLMRTPEDEKAKAKNARDVI